MILEITGNGPLGRAVRHILGRAHEEVRSAYAEADDLFMRAIGCRAIVYAPASSLLDGQLDPQPNPARMRAVVGAANAPGVSLVVVVAPLGDRYSDEERVLKKSGVPYVILRCAPLLEELPEAANFHVTGSLWLPTGRVLALARAPELEDALLSSLTDGNAQGGTIDVDGERLDLVEAIRRAAHIAGGAVDVHALSPHVGHAYHVVAALLHLKPPPAAALYEKLAPLSH